MSEQQILQAIYLDLKSSTFGSYTKVNKELELLGMAASNEEIEILHSLVINASSLKEALDLSNKLSGPEKLKLRNEIYTNNKIEEEKKNKEEEKKKAEKDKRIEQKEKIDMNQAIKAIKSQGSNQITEYTVVHEKSLMNIEQTVRLKMEQGWVPFGGIGAAAFGISPVGGNSYIQAMVKYKK